MQRRTFDRIVSWVGAGLTAILLLAAGGLYYGYNYANDNVSAQLEPQNIVFPEGKALEDPRIEPYLRKYAGQKLTTGAQAEAYANHYIAVHLEDVADGKTYAELSTLARANPQDQKLAGQVQTLFRGETLRGLLLTAYGFWKMGQLALIGSIVALAAGIAMAVMTVLGFRHVARVPQDQTMFVPRAQPVAG
ncbi:MAG: hypothetical protein ACRDKW_09365 [Actinomycetota bacterium]